MVFNVKPVGGISESGGLVEISQIAPQVWVVYDTLLVTLNCYRRQSTASHNITRRIVLALSPSFQHNMQKNVKKKGSGVHVGMWLELCYSTMYA